MDNTVPPKTESIPFKIHPRTFKALGNDLVTNDNVAIIELVKNSYDAGATLVTIHFITSGDLHELIIDDNGDGMNEEIIKNTWLTVSTPYRKVQTSSSGSQPGGRRVSGEKGLGRLASARLGTNLQMETRTANEHGWRVDVDWERLSNSDTLEQCTATLTPISRSKPGTTLKIYPLKAEWNKEKWDNLRSDLSRLLMPFEEQSTFAIHLHTPADGSDEPAPAKIEPPKFLNYPKYKIKGKANANGEVSYVYEFKSISDETTRFESGKIAWSQVAELSGRNRIIPAFGPFSFEIRAWDIGPQDTQEIANRFEYGKREIRDGIKAYKGISVYRDGILVLPKSDEARDWLGLDTRRIDKVGIRLSTTQIVGYVGISAENNPLIEDTSDRERLVSSDAVTAFESTIFAIVRTLESERTKDRTDRKKPRAAKGIFAKVDASGLVQQVQGIAKRGSPASEAVAPVELFNKELSKTRVEIEDRFEFYSRLAAVGSLAEMLVHEISARTSKIHAVVVWLSKRVKASNSDEVVSRKLQIATESLQSLDRLADMFAPLATKRFRRRLSGSLIIESAERVTALLTSEISSSSTTVEYFGNRSVLAEVDPAELDAILINLATNSLYWMKHKGTRPRVLRFEWKKHMDGRRVKVQVHDSGPGVPKDDSEIIFHPGVTSKPGGIGMGLVVASEIVTGYGGILKLLDKSVLGGASFGFDLPVKEHA